MRPLHSAKMELNVESDTFTFQETLNSGILQTLFSKRYVLAIDKSERMESDTCQSHV